jgi:predicted  nucleic acid-binding Zn-ribbon protein
VFDVVDFDTEPCPNCGNRIKPIKREIMKQCPICGFMWFESESGGGKAYCHPIA